MLRPLGLPAGLAIREGIFIYIYIYIYFGMYIYLYLYTGVVLVVHQRLLFAGFVELRIIFTRSFRLLLAVAAAVGLSGCCSIMLIRMEFELLLRFGNCLTRFSRPDLRSSTRGLLMLLCLDFVVAVVAA